MSKEVILTEYMSEGINNIVKNVLKSSLKNPKETAFVMKFGKAVKDSKKARDEFESKGEHIPPFLMASIATNCNLHCKGCYARANKSCGSNLKDTEISEERWGEIFKEASELGISFALLLGGEPLMRKGVIERAALVKEIVFPIFTNGTMIDKSYIELFDKNRNLVPMISIEGNKEQTDGRRGIGTYNKLIGNMEKLNDKGILFGGSITVTTENLNTISSEEFIRHIYEKGGRALVFVEYVPVDKNSRNLALTDKERLLLEEKIVNIKNKFPNMIFLSFPGDEKALGGCLAAGRGFFHINASGSAEPCPFSPYSDINLKECSVRDALKSNLFRKLKENEVLSKEHEGGCVLFENEDDVRKLLDL